MERRLDQFRDGLIKEFGEGGGGNPKAFADPDFQGSLLDAQKAFARSGDESLETVLVDLVSQRSKCEARDRLSLTLNDAISKAGSLTNEDFDFLALIFVFKNLQRLQLVNIEALATWFRSITDPLVNNEAGELAASYLESHGCIRTSVGNMMGFKSGFQILCQRYPSPLSKGLTKAELQEFLPEDSPIWDSPLIQRSEFGADLFHLPTGDAELIDLIFDKQNLGEKFGESYVDLLRKKPMSEEEFYSRAECFFPKIRLLVKKYDQPEIRNSTLTSIGLALSHARLSKMEGFEAPLDIWIK